MSSRAFWSYHRIAASVDNAIAIMRSNIDQVFREVPYMGVIYVVHEASKRGFRNLHPDWCNLGQGQPEVGEMKGAPPRLATLKIDPTDLAYGPVGGIDDLKQAVADYYNRLYRRGKRSQYRKENVAIAAGGRLVLSRLVAALGACRLGHLVPDYTAYEDLFEYHQHRVEPVAIATGPETGFHLSPGQIGEIVERERLQALLFSNPCNPTGNVVQGNDLAGYLKLARDRNVWLLLDEFYSHFIYEGDGAPGSGGVSGAEFVDDCDRDPVVLIDGLTKNFRYPGLRVGWAVGPSEIIENIARSASAIDGGPPTVMQRAAVEILEPARVDQETTALREQFAIKRAVMIDALQGMGIEIARPGRGTFYLWGSVRNLPAPLNDADAFFLRGLDEKVMTVPGRFFDVNPGRRRNQPHIDSSWVRFSFGPPLDNVKLGLDRLRRMVKSERSWRAA